MDLFFMLVSLHFHEARRMVGLTLFWIVHKRAPCEQVRNQEGLAPLHNFAPLENYWT